MIKHVVTWTLQDEALGQTKKENVAKFQKMLLDLVGIIDEIKSFEVGVKGESSPADNHDIVLISEFESWDALQAYNTHPEHQKVVAFAKQVVKTRAAVDFIL